MKLLKLISLAIIIFATSCTTSVYLGEDNGYDDIYYSPGDEVISEKPAQHSESYDNEYENQYEDPAYQDDYYADDEYYYEDTAYYDDTAY